MTDQESTTRRKKKKQKKTDYTPFIIIGVLAIVVLVVVILTTIKPAVELTDPTFHKATITDGLTMGDPNAPVKVVEYADFQCPYCGIYWSSIEPTIVADYIETGKVFYTYVPFSFVGSYVANNPWDESIKSAEAAYCANDQGKFWEYRDYIFANQNGENEGTFSREFLIAVAKKLELDTKTFTTCLDDETHYQDVIDSNSYAVEMGINTTPSISVNGTVVEIDGLTAAIEAALNP